MNREDIKEAVSSILPGLPLETLTSPLEVFEELCVKSWADLILLQEKVLNGIENERR